MVRYDALGNISSRSDLGIYRYGASDSSRQRPHAIRQLDLYAGGYRTYRYDANGNFAGEAEYDANNNPLAGKGRIEVYTSFNMPFAFGSAGSSAAYQYGPEHQRVMQNSSSQGTTIYLNPGNNGDLLYEKQIKPDNTVEQRSYLTAYGMVIGVVKQIAAAGGTTTQVQYFHRDHLGSTTAVTDQNGAVLEQLAYEAFGKRRFPSGVADPGGSIAGASTARGYTNHEHIDELGLIHMNGRIYDPVIGRFMSADPQIQAPGNLQSYNRYSYGFNIPLGGMDPSGYGFLSDLAGAWRDVWRSTAGRVVITVAVAWFTGQYVGEWATNSIWASEATCTVSGATYGSIIGNTAGGFAGGFVGSGGDFQMGLKGAVNGGISGAVDGYFTNPSSLERVAAKSFAGGVAESIQGGRFGDGFLTAGVMSGARYAYNNLVGYDVTWASGENRPGDTDYEPVSDRSSSKFGQLKLQDIGRNIIGFNANYDPTNSCLFCENTFRQGSPLSRALNMIPGGNGIAGLDDYINNVVPTSLGESALFKLVTIPIAVGVTVPALFDRVPVYRPQRLVMH